MANSNGDDMENIMNALNEEEGVTNFAGEIHISRDSSIDNLS